jgi:dihydroflavonol-4-reductase
MKVLVTGATGFLGKWLTKRLRAEGHDVRVLVRSKHRLSEDRDLQKLDLDISEGDVTDLNSLETATRGVQGVFHLAGLIAYKRTDRPAMDAINVQGTKNVLEAIRRNGGARLLHLSSVAAVGAGFTPQDILNEESPYNIAHLNLGYFETKHAAELAVIDAAKRGELEAVCVNPSTIYGAGDSEKGSRGVQLKVAQGKFPFYPPGGVNVVHVEDVVDVCLKAFHIGRSGERTIVCGENLLLKDLFERIAAIAGCPPPGIGLPRPALFALGAVGDLMEKVNLKGPISSENAWTSVLYHWFSHEKATRDFGFKPRPVQDALESSIRWSRENGKLAAP